MLHHDQLWHYSLGGTLEAGAKCCGGVVRRAGQQLPKDHAVVAANAITVNANRNTLQKL